MGNDCRVCGGPLFDKPLLEYKNMPGAAQYMPSEYTLENDSSVDLKICQCSGCALVQLSNDPVPYYRESIRATSFSVEMSRFRKAQFSDFIKKYDLKRKKIIEIGCGKGHYLSIMDELGVDAQGIEYSSKSVAECTKMGLNVEEGFIEDRHRKLKNSPFDAFLIMSFLEHLPEPNATMGGIYNNLTSDGFGLVEVPNFDMVLKNNLFAEFIGDHLFYFTEETLRRTLTIHGFDVVDCQPIWYDYILSAVVKKRDRHNLSRFQSYREQTSKEIENYLDQFAESTVAIWGAGHQALAIMSMAQLGGKIKYVVDSATFKQGRFTPVTHLPIVGPDKLDLDPPIAVIVMAASYSDEVIKILQKNYDSGINIATLKQSGLRLIQ